jgi:hypothetical protein
MRTRFLRPFVLSLSKGRRMMLAGVGKHHPGFDPLNENGHYRKGA